MGRRILLLFGGASTEHEISQRSARTIAEGLLEAGAELAVVGIGRRGDFIPFHLGLEEITAGDWERRARAQLEAEGLELNYALSQGFSVRDLLFALAGGPVDLVFPAVHGINCEDGALQGLLTLSGLPYVGSHVLASAACMDKVVTKRLVPADIPQLPYLLLERQAIQADIYAEIRYVEEELAYPCFVKPANGGSSVGAQKAGNEEELKLALEQAVQFDHQILVEEFCPARELEVAVLGNETPVAAQVGAIEVQEEGTFYDYSSKYESATAAVVRVPAEIEDYLAERLRDMALRIYKSLGCLGLARVDFFYNEERDAIYFNEINNLPGFTSISVYPRAFAAAGISVPELVTRLCDLALEAHSRLQRREWGKEAADGQGQ